MERVSSHRASQYMQGSLRDQRANTRTSLHLSGSVKRTHREEEMQVALSRDLSTGGLFFFSNLAAEVGEDLTLNFTTPHGGCLLFQGRVVRVEHRSPGAARGIALVLRSRMLAS